MSSRNGEAIRFPQAHGLAAAAVVPLVVAAAATAAAAATVVAAATTVITATAKLKINIQANTTPERETRGDTLFQLLYVELELFHLTYLRSCNATCSLPRIVFSGSSLYVNTREALHSPPFLVLSAYACTLSKLKMRENHSKPVISKRNISYFTSLYQASLA
jgi:hypothetical protein